jgi:hypothetical protein
MQFLVGFEVNVPEGATDAEVILESFGGARP